MSNKLCSKYRKDIFRKIESEAIYNQLKVRCVKVLWFQTLFAFLAAN